MEKTYPRTSQISRLYQKLIIVYSEGTKVEATIFRADIELFQGTLKEGKKYYISNALVRPYLYAHKAVGNKYQWVINGVILVEEVANVKEEKITKFNFIPLGELSSFTEASSTTCLRVAAVIRVHPVKQITTRYGDTTIQELLVMDECIEHKDAVSMLLINKSDEMPRISTTGPTSENIFTTSTLGDVQPAENFWLKVTASITNFNQKFWYTGCSKCFKAIHIECGKVYKCNYCKEEMATVTPRPRFNVQLDDDYGYIIANYFCLNAKRLFDLTAATLKNHTDEDGVTNKEFLEKVSKTKHQVFLLKPCVWKGQQWFTILSSKDKEA